MRPTAAANGILFMARDVPGPGGDESMHAPHQFLKTLSCKHNLQFWDTPSGLARRVCPDDTSPYFVRTRTRVRRARQGRGGAWAGRGRRRQPRAGGLTLATARGGLTVECSSSRVARSQRDKPVNS